jgi:hypothetical protein
MQPSKSRASTLETRLLLEQYSTLVIGPGAFRAIQSSAALCQLGLIFKVLLAT